MDASHRRDASIMSSKTATTTIEVRAAEALQVARAAAKKIRQWQDLHNHLFGVFGQMFPTRADRLAFSQTEESRQIHELLAERLKETGIPQAPVSESSGAFNLRLPKSLHAALVLEAEREGVSLNQLCVAKLGVELAEVART
jgi:predicted HicB family RNase H-like nuclease